MTTSRLSIAQSCSINGRIFTNSCILYIVLWRFSLAVYVKTVSINLVCVYQVIDDIYELAWLFVCARIFVNQDHQNDIRVPLHITNANCQHHHFLNKTAYISVFFPAVCMMYPIAKICLQSKNHTTWLGLGEKMTDIQYNTVQCIETRRLNSAYFHN